MKLTSNGITRRACLLNAAMLGAALAAGPAPAGIRELSWADLVPPSPEIENPFEALTGEQREGLGVIARSRQLAAAGSPSPSLDEAARSAEDKLAAEGVDVDALLAKREEIIAIRTAASEAVDRTLDGAEVKMPGYLLPLSFDGPRATEFLLVPFVGACIHVPPPPPNQIVHVRFAEGYEVQGLYTPVTIEGRMSVGITERELTLVDGTGDIPVGYAMDAVSIEKYRN